GLSTTNRLLCYMADNGRIIDYVQLNGMNDNRNLLGEIATNNITGYYGLWSTNRVGGTASLSDFPLGIVNQIQVSLGNSAYDVPSAAWLDQNVASGVKLRDS